MFAILKLSTKRLYSKKRVNKKNRGRKQTECRNKYELPFYAVDT